MSQRQQMNVPKRTRNNEEVQTDVNLLNPYNLQQLATQSIHSDSKFLEFTSESWMLPFSDYYLLNQLNSVIQQLKNNLPVGEEYQTKRIVNELASKIHGLLARELKVTAKDAGYYDILLDKEKELTKLEIKYGSFEKKIDGYMRKIKELEDEISGLRATLKNYQGAAQENQIYKSFFKEMKDLTVTSKRVTDFERIINQQILPKIKECEVNLADVSRSASRERSSKQKAAISRFALELDGLSKTKDLNWETLSFSAGAFFSSIEHLNNDDWVQQRLSLADSYKQLRERHIAVLSLVSKNVDELLKKDPAFEQFNQISEFIGILDKENGEGYETAIVNGWIGLGVIHCHRESSVSSQTLTRLQSLIALFQTEITKLCDKYPQLNQSLSPELRKFINYKVSSEIQSQNATDWLQNILIKQTEIIHVDNVYNYYSKSDKQDIYYLKILVKSLIDQLKRINNDHKIGLQLDQGVLEILKKQALDGVNVEDVAALFRPSARVCEVGFIVDRPNYIYNTNTVGVPLKQETAVVVADTSHFAVNLQQGVPYRKEIPYEYAKSEVVEVPVTIEKPYAVPTKVVEEVISYEKEVVVEKVPVQTDKYIEVIKEVQVRVPDQVFGIEQIEKEVRVPYHTNEVETRQIVVDRQIPKTVYKEINKIFKVEQAVPKVYKEPKFEIVERPVHHVVVQKEIQFVEIEKPIIEKHEVAKITQLVVEKPIYYTDHCDCQKPEHVVVEVQKPIFKEYPKEIIIEKCHFVQPNVEERIVEVACEIQVPVFKEVIKEQPVFIEKVVPFRTIEEKLVVVDRQVPFFIQHFTPVELVVEKPVIVRDIKHVPVEVEHPVPVYIEKIVPKIVEVYVDKIVEKIVEVPKVQIVQKIVQKIVVVPRIVERIVTQIQRVEVPVFIETPILEVVEIPVERLVVDVQEKQKIVEVKTEVLVIERNLEVVDRIDYQEVRKVIEVEPEIYPEIVVEKIVKVIEEKPIEVYLDRIVDRVVHIRDVVPVEQRVEIPIEVQMPVQIITEKPIFYKQPVVKIDVQRVQRDKIVELEQEIIQIKEVQVPYIQREKEIVELPGQTIILKEPELHIIQIEKENIITATDVEDRPVGHYFDLHKPHVVEQQTFVIPEKEACYLERPVPISVERPVMMRSEEMVVVERPNTVVIKTREGPSEQRIKIITQEKLVAQRESYPQPIPVPEHHYHVVYQQLPPKSYQKSVLAIDQKIKSQIITNTVQIQAANKQILTKHIEVPVYMQKIIEKIMMLPQVVEVEKKVYMVEEINSLIAKEVNLETHQHQYRMHVGEIQKSVAELLAQINTGRQANTAEFKKKLNLFLELLRTQSRIPKIVESIREVEVIKERDRPVLVPVYDNEREKVLHCIISDLMDGIKGMDKTEIERRFPERVRNIFAYEFGFGGLESQSPSFILQKGEEAINTQSKWKSWLDNYDKNLPNTVPQQSLTESEQIFIMGHDSQEMDYVTIKASLQRLTLIHKQRLYEMEKLRTQYGEMIAELRNRNQVLESAVSNQRYYKDLYYSELLKIRSLLEEKQYEQVVGIINRITSMKEEMRRSTIVPDYSTQREGRVSGSVSAELEGRISELLSQLTVFEGDLASRNRQIHNISQENSRLRFEIDEIKLSIPREERQSGSQADIFNDYKDKISEMERNHFMELNHLREQLVKKITQGSSGTSEDFARNYEELMAKYSELSQSQLTSENAKRNLINSYEDRVKDLNKELITLKRDLESTQSRSESERRRLIDDYERRIASTSSSQEQELRRELQAYKSKYETLQQRTEADKSRMIDDYEKKISSTASTQERELKRELDQAKRNLELSEKMFQQEKKKIIDDYEAKARLSAGNQERELRREYDTLKRNSELAEQRFESEKRRIQEDYERRMTTTANTQERQLKMQLEQLKRNYQMLENSSALEKKRLTDEYETKLRSTGSAQERELKRELDIVKRNYENLQRNTETIKIKTTEQYERKISQMQEDLDRMKTSRRSGPSNTEQIEELQLLKDKIKKLEIELDCSKKEVENYQKSRLGQTTYTSGIKQSLLESEYQSPQARYRSGGYKFEDVVEGSAASQEGEAPTQRYQLSGEGEKGRVSKSGIRPGRREEEDLRSSSSRVSGRSETSVFKSSMTMKQLMDIKKSEEKDSIITLVIIKIMEKIIEESEKGIINSYNPSNIYFNNFNPSNLDSLVVRFGAPITNRKSLLDGLYLAPEVLRGEGTDLKSVVFTLAVIWDELIHEELYYKRVEDIENPAYEYKVRDTTLNPILRNTIFEMMAKDPSKRIDLLEAKRRISLQRYIVSEVRTGTTISRVTIQSKKEE